MDFFFLDVATVRVGRTDNGTVISRNMQRCKVTCEGMVNGVLSGGRNDCTVQMLNNNFEFPVMWESVF